MSRFGAGLLKAVNRIFPRQVHPFNLTNEGRMTYADWQFERGYATLQFYEPDFAPEQIFKGKVALDCGCGEGGKSVYYASLGAEKIVGIDIFEDYAPRAREFAEKKGYGDVFEFQIADASALQFPDDHFDTVIMNDFIEHVSEPEKALREAFRVLKPGGRIYANFPPYYHPFGAHLSDVIGIPWVHRFFSEDSLIRAYKDLVKDQPDAESRIRFRFSTDENGKEYISYINKMTIRRFESILKAENIKPLIYRLTPLRPFLSGPAGLKLFREDLNKMVTCVIEKQDIG